MSSSEPGALIPAPSSASPCADHDFVSVRLFGGVMRIVRARFPDGDVERERLLEIPLPGLSGEAGLRWDLASMAAVVRDALHQLAGGSGVLRSVAVEGFGADYGWLDGSGERCGEVVSHLSPAGLGDVAAATALVDAEDWYRRTGVPLRPVQTALRWRDERAARREPRGARSLVLLPDLLRHALGGELGVERSVAASTNLLGAADRAWDRELVRKLGLEPTRLPPLVDSGTDLGSVREPGLEGVHVVAAPSDELAAAVAAIPPAELFVRSGSFARIGFVRPPAAPRPEHRALELFHTPTVGAQVLHQEVMGSFLVEEARRAARLVGRELASELHAPLDDHEVETLPLLRPDDPRLRRPLNMLEAARVVLRDGGAGVPEGDDALLRCLGVSMICDWAERLQDLSEQLGLRSGPLWLLGAAEASRGFLQSLSDATGRELRTGPGDEMGGLLVQAVRDGRFRNLEEARRHLHTALPRRRVFPVHPDRWARLRRRFARLGRPARAAAAEG